MLSRRSLLLLAALPLVRQRDVGTPVATPAASPVVASISIVGEGTLRDAYGESTFEIDLTVNGGEFEGGFVLETHATEKVIWKVESTEFVLIGALSEKSPQIKRITGYATVNGSSEQPFLLDLTDSTDSDKPDQLNFVLGLEALPFLGEQIKEGCDCGIGVALRASFIEGGFTITE